MGFPAENSSSVHSSQFVSLRSAFRQSVKRGLGFFKQEAGFGFLLFEAFDHVRRSFGQKALVAQLALGCCQAFFILGDILCQALALGGDVDGALVDNGNVESGVEVFVSRR